MRKSCIFALMALILSSIVACNGKKGNGSQEEQTAGWEDLIGYSDIDSTLYGICTEETTMNELQMLTDSGDTLTIGIASARNHNKLMGGIGVGDRMAVLTNSEKTDATMVVNLSVLVGQWVMPNPMDGSSEMGIYIKDGGIAESINMGTLLYQSWRLHNGQLEIVSMRDDGGNFEETTSYQLLFLTNDSLAIKDTEGTYEYKRPAPEEDYSNDLGIELDEGSYEDFAM